MRPLVLILFLPRRAAGLLRLQPRWLGAFLLLAVLETAGMALEHSAQVDRTVRSLPPGVTGSDRASVAEDLNARLIPRALVHPARLLLGWSSFSLLLFVAGRAVSPGVPLRYLQFLALNIHCESAEVLGRWVMAVLQRLPGIRDLLSGMGSLGPLLNSVNIFTLWYVVLLIGGVSVLSTARPLKATLVVFLVWGSSLAFHTAVLRMLQEYLHLTL